MSKDGGLRSSPYLTSLVQASILSNMATSDEKLKTIVQILKVEFNPTRIFLFGSRATGHPRSDSDYDLVLIDAKSTLPKIERMQRASDLLYPLGVTADVFFYSKSELRFVIFFFLFFFSFFFSDF